MHWMSRPDSEPREVRSLQGVYGRTTGSIARLSLLRHAPERAHHLERPNSRKWLTDPDTFLPGNNMDFLVAKPQEREDLIAYFKQSAGM